MTEADAERILGVMLLGREMTTSDICNRLGELYSKHLTPANIGHALKRARKSGQVVKDAIPTAHGMVPTYRRLR